MILPVAITGRAVASPYGWGVTRLFDALLTGTSAVRRISHFNTTDYPCSIGAPFSDADIPSRLLRPDCSRLEQLALALLEEAWSDSQFSGGTRPSRVGLIIGTSGECSWNWEMMPSGSVEETDRPALATTLARLVGPFQPVLTLSTACSSGNSALGQAQRWLNLNWCDVCLVIALDLAITPLVLASFGNLRAVSRRNDRPEQASRPFDRDRDGFVLGEGGAAFVLERCEDAGRRDAKVHGELLAVGLTADAHHPVVPLSTGESAARSIRRALKMAQLVPAQVDVINAHGTGTPVGDIAEAAAIRLGLDEAASRCPVSATKSLTGHLIAGASAVEAAICLEMLQRQVVPATANLDHVDPACDLCHVRGTPLTRQLQVAMSTSFGFGGSNTCALFRGRS